MEQTTDDTDTTEEDSLWLSENLYVDGSSTRLDCNSFFLNSDTLSHAESDGLVRDSTLQCWWHSQLLNTLTEGSEMYGLCLGDWSTLTPNT